MGEDDAGTRGKGGAEKLRQGTEGSKSPVWDTEERTEYALLFVTVSSAGASGTAHGASIFQTAIHKAGGLGGVSPSRCAGWCCGLMSCGGKAGGRGL